MILAALILIALLAVALIASVALVARDLSVEHRDRRAADSRLPLSV